MSVDILEEGKKSASFIDLNHLTGAMIKLSSSFGIDYSDLVKLNPSLIPNRYDIPVKTGKFTTEGIFKSKDIAVAKSYASKETIMECHHHVEWEIVYVEEGELHLTIDGEVQKYTKGQIVVLSPDAPHQAYWPVDTILLCITIPASPAWPDPSH